jgi:hypothetical protein
MMTVSNACSKNSHRKAATVWIRNSGAWNRIQLTTLNESRSIQYIGWSVFKSEKLILLKKREMLFVSLYFLTTLAF